MAHGGQDQCIAGDIIVTFQGNQLEIADSYIENIIYSTNQDVPYRIQSSRDEEECKSLTVPASDGNSERTESDIDVGQLSDQKGKSIEGPPLHHDQNTNRFNNGSPDSDLAGSSRGDTKSGLSSIFATIFKSKSKKSKNDFEISKEDKKRIKYLKHKLKKPLEKLTFSDAVNYATEIQRLQRQDKLEYLLLIAECELHLDRKQTEESIRNIEEFISKEKEDSSTIAKNQGYEMKQKSQYVRAVILYKIWHDLAQGENMSSGAKMKLISHQVACIANAMQPLLTAEMSSTNVALKYGMKSMLSMLTNLQEMAGDDKTRVLMEVRCLVNITGISNQLGDFDTSIKYGEEGVTKFKRQFHEYSVKYQHYGWLMHNIGNSYYNLERYSEADEVFSKAVDAKAKYGKTLENDIQLSLRILVIIRKVQKNK